MIRASPSKAGLDVGLVTHDFARMRDFYGRGLGLELVDSLAVQWGTLHRFRCGDSFLKLLEPSSDRTREEARGIDAVAGIRFITLWLDNIDDVWEQAVAGGAQIYRPIRQIDGTGISVGMLHDPDGNVVELIRDAAQR